MRPPRPRPGASGRSLRTPPDPTSAVPVPAPVPAPDLDPEREPRPEPDPGPHDGTRPSGSSGGSPGQVVVFDGTGWVAASWEMAAGVSVDLDLIDGLCRLRQAARAMGWSVALHDPSVDLREVLDFVGLAGVVPTVDSAEPIDWAGSVVEVVGHPEQGEELGTEEVVQPDDLAT